MIRTACVLVAQFGLNVLNLLDHALNCLLLGDADETVSARVARARKDGRPWAVWLCGVLTTTTRVVTFGRITHDHCDYALDKRVRPNSRELFDLSTMRFNPIPISRVQVIYGHKNPKPDIDQPGSDL